MNPWTSGSSRFELGSDGPGTIVVGLGCSESSWRVLAYAAGVARRQRSRLVAVHVRRPLGTTTAWTAGVGLDALGPAVAAAVEAQESREADLLGEARELTRSWGVPIDFVVRSGDPFKELSAVAEEHRADAVIVGSSRRTGNRLTTSLSVRLVRQRGWPVTVVP